MIKTYKQPKKIRYIAIFGLVIFNPFLIYLSTNIFQSDYDIYNKTFHLLSCFAFTVGINYSFLEILIEKISITDDSIIYKTIFNRKSLKLTNIKGYTLRNKNIYLIPFNDNLKGFSFSQNLEDKEKIISYFSKDVSKSERNKWKL